MDQHKIVPPFKIDGLGLGSVIQTSLIAVGIVVILNLIETFANFNLNDVNIGSFNLGFLQNYYSIAFVFVAQFLKKGLTYYESEAKIKATEIDNLTINK